MLILSVDSTAAPASVCLYDDKIIAEYYIHTGLTHSQTLMVMIDSVLKLTETRFRDVDLFAVNAGPGSFTGVRIGVSAVKGMAFPLSKPCAAVSTLESMAYNFLDIEGIVCACMDARRNQVYNALFKVENGSVTRLTEDRAISVDELYREVFKMDGPVWIAGDGAKLFFDTVPADADHIHLAPDNVRFQKASSTAIAAKWKAERGETLSAGELTPSYLRLSQAERERNSKKNSNA